MCGGMLDLGLGPLISKVKKIKKGHMNFCIPVYKLTLLIVCMPSWLISSIEDNDSGEKELWEVLGQ